MPSLPPRRPGALQRAARGCAVAGGLLLTAVTAVTCASLAGRNTTGWTLVGDFELVAAATGAAVALFLPWCQVRRAHVRVDFFTAAAPPALRGALDRAGAALTALLLAALAWRGALAGLSAWRSGAESMLLALPEWTVHAAMVPALALAAAVAAAQALGRPGAGCDGEGDRGDDGEGDGAGERDADIDLGTGVDARGRAAAPAAPRPPERAA